ncbi:Ca2+ regulator and membrane fusion protein Fig1-domain-containing protein [Aspergillus ambiguus]|uniref:Fig1 domain-containing protein n=1 Tax=Aspergillus ambiguus TaxID=176160 RepID=UPI003CCC9EE9
MVICSVAIIFLSILLAGCTSSNGLSNVYLVSLRYRNTSASAEVDPEIVNPSIAEKIYGVMRPLNDKIIEVRAGYMGLCLTRSDHSRLCSSSAAALASMARADGNNGTADPLNLIWIAKNFKETIVFDGLIFIAVVLIFICFLLLSTFPGWHEEVDESGSEREVRPFPSRPVAQGALGLSTLGFLFGLVSILWQHINSSAAGAMSESLSYGAIESHVGTAAMVFGWIAVVCMGIVALALLATIMSVSLLQQLTDEEL